MALKHFADEHLLVFMKYPRRPPPSGIFCDQCNEDVLGSCYSCFECRFDLHKSCAEDELPRELHHPIHPKHPLILFKTPPYDDKACTCNGCNQPWKRFVYHCSLCNFNLDIKCAFLPLKKEAEVHEHPLTLLRRSISFTCDLCGQEGKGMLYLCADCPFWVHLSCASLPRRVKNIRHTHPLNLNDSLHVDKSDHNFCQLCVKKINIDYGVYFCSSCNFVAHLHCATDKASIEDIKKSDVQDTVPNESTVKLDFKDEELNESIDPAYDVKKFDAGTDGNKIVTEIKHFSHTHDLVITNELEKNEKCDACRRPIFPPAFSCAKCGFYLHKWCAELPRKKRHPLHKHPLILKTDWTIRCSACRHLYNNSFIYDCEECEFCLDVQCGSIFLDNLTHEGHEHPLVLSNEKGNCNACGKDKGYLFRCAICDFALNFGCAMLPHMVRYESHEHPFILTYHTVDDGSDEYYCDICEELRDPKHWYYYCPQCDYPTHPKCILGEYPYFDFDHTYKSNAHQHPLIEIPWTNYLCDKCGLNHGSLIGYKCTQCNFHIYYTCLWELENEI